MRKGRILLYALASLWYLCVVRSESFTNATPTTLSTTLNITDEDQFNTTRTLSTFLPFQLTTINPASSPNANVSEAGDDELINVISTTSKPSSTRKPSTTVFSVREATTKAPAGSSLVAGIFILIIIIIIIIILVVILYLLWRKGKRYSFDLTNNDHDTPLRSMEHGVLFETTKESPAVLEYVQDEKQNDTKPAANGCAGESPELKSSPEPQNIPEENSFTSDSSLSSPVKKVEFNLDLDLIGEPKSANQDSPEPTDLDQNENNNNDSSAGINSLDMFTEINLDEPQ